MKKKKPKKKKKKKKKRNHINKTMSNQTEKAFQKQSAVFIGRKGKKGKSGVKRYYKNIGLGFKTPQEAINGTYVDKKCPFTSDVSIRGRILKGIVHKAKMKNTIVVRRNYLHYIKKYQRFEKDIKMYQHIVHQHLEFKKVIW